MPTPSNVPPEYAGRITEQYLLDQVNSVARTDYHNDHKERIREFDDLYRGMMSTVFKDETSLPDKNLVENKLKNATHDLARLASEARGAPIFMKDGEGKTASKRQAVRSAIAETEWHMGGGRAAERKCYLDLIAAGYAAFSVYYNSESDYPIFDRLNPRMCYPDVRNGKLHSMVYIENMKERIAYYEFPDVEGLDPKSDKEVLVVQYFDKNETCQYLCKTNARGGAISAAVLTRWEHGLGCVPVAWKPLDSADDTFHGLFDQLGGPMMARNKIMRLFLDYMESMVHAPFESKGVLNDTDEPGPLTVYRHDDTFDGESFIRRVAPAQPAGAAFGVMQQLAAEEAAEAIQPPARVGVVRQSIASGSFVDSTQGTLSSVIFELQDVMAEIRRDAQYIAFKIEEKFLDREKPLLRSIGRKSMYKPSEDLKGFYYHNIQYGASAGLNRQEAASRVLMDLGAGLIDKELARQQIDYIEDVTSVQDRIDRDQLSNVFFQRMTQDPNVPNSLIAQAIIAMGAGGKSMLDVIEELEPKLIEYESQAREEAVEEGGLAQPEGTEEAAAEMEDLANGAIPELDFAPAPLQQQILRNPVG